jgi:hypothetical protein
VSLLCRILPMHGQRSVACAVAEVVYLHCLLRLFGTINAVDASAIVVGWLVLRMDVSWDASNASR